MSASIQRIFERSLDHYDVIQEIRKIWLDAGISKDYPRGNSSLFIEDQKGGFNNQGVEINEEDIPAFLSSARKLKTTYRIHRGQDKFGDIINLDNFTEDEIIKAVQSYPGGTEVTQKKFLAQLGLELPKKRRVITIEVDAHLWNSEAFRLEDNIKTLNGRGIGHTLANPKVLKVEDKV